MTSQKISRRGACILAFGFLLHGTVHAQVIQRQCATVITGTPPALNQTANNWGTPTTQLFNGSLVGEYDLRVLVDKTRKDIYVSWTVNFAVPMANVYSPLYTYVGVGNNNAGTLTGTLFRVDIPGNPPTGAENVLLSGSAGAGELRRATVTTSQSTSSALSLVSGAQFNDGSTTGSQGVWLNVSPTGASDALMTVTMRIHTYQSGADPGDGSVLVSSLDNFLFWSQTAEPLATRPGGGDASLVGWPQSVNGYTGTTLAADANAILADGWGSILSVAGCQGVTGEPVFDPNFMGRVDTSSPDQFSSNLSLFGPATAPLNTQLPLQNTVMAYLFNSTGQTLPLSDFKLQFTIATWGSSSGSFVILDDKGNDVTASGGVKRYSDDVSAPVTITGADPLPPGGVARASISWKAAMSFACQFQNATGQLLDQIYVDPTQCKSVNPQTLLPQPTPGNDSLGSHQCLVVQAQSAGGHFSNTQSPWRNMDFVNASHFTRQAVIDTRGLKPLKGKNGHFIYLYLETRNMPIYYPDGEGREIVYPKVTDKERLVPFRPISPANDWRASFPTYLVHVYHETGRTMVGRGKHPRVVDLLEEQPAFGFYVGHTGSKTYGWSPRLTGAEEIAPNFYRLSIPNNGKAYVRTTVDTKDEPCRSKKWKECHEDWGRKHPFRDDDRR